MSDIFISYARADKAQAERLANAFSMRGWSVWWDREIPPGKSFDEVIEAALNSAKCVVVLWSKESVSSRWVKTEAAEGAARGILIPVFVERVQPPLEFKRIEAADLSDWRGDSSHAEFNGLLRTVNGLVGGTAEPPNYLASGETQAGSRPWWRAIPGKFAIAAGVVAIIAVSFMLQRRSAFQENEPQPQTQTPTASNPSAAQESPAESPLRGAQQVGPTANSIPGGKPRGGLNLLARENGGRIIAATNDQWAYTIDGDEKSWQYIDIGISGAWAVYAFRDEKPATFDTFKLLIPDAASWNLNEFELLAGNESATGKFDSIGKFHTQNIRFFKDPYQEFKFPPVTARYFKVKVVSSHGFGSVGAYEFQLLGAPSG